MSTISSECHATDLLKHTYRVPEALMTGRHTEVLKTVTTQYNLWKKHLPEAYKHYFHDTNELIPSSSYLAQKVNAFVNAFWQCWTGQPEFKLPFAPSCWSYIYDANEAQLREDANLPPPLFAIKYKKLDMFKALLKKTDLYVNINATSTFDELSAEINAKDSDGHTPLHYAAMTGRVEMIRILVELDADINAKDNDGFTPLHLAAYYGKVKAIHTLVELDADINAKNDDGWTPLHKAAMKGQVEAIHTLVELDADINAKNDNGWTPLHWAVMTGQVEAIHTLVELDADINAKGHPGFTPLHTAAEWNRIEACNALASLGADLYAPLPNGETVIEAYSDLDFSQAIENYNLFNSTRLAHMAYAAHYEALYRHSNSPKPSRVQAYLSESHFSDQ